MPPMHVTKDLNLGTIVTIALFLIAQSTAAVWWAATISAKVEATAITVIATRAWQTTQDDRLGRLEANDVAVRTQMSAVQALLEDMRQDIRTNNNLLIRELRDGRPNRLPTLD